MANHRYFSGISNAASYQVSGRPWITGSALSGTATATDGQVQINFPAITKSFTVINRDASTLYIHFDSVANANVVNYGHYVSLTNQDDSFGFDVRSKTVYISLSGTFQTGSFELFAELTGIRIDDMSDNWLSGSGINNQPTEFVIP